MKVGTSMTLFSSLYVALVACGAPERPSNPRANAEEVRSIDKTELVGTTSWTLAQEETAASHARALLNLRANKELDIRAELVELNAARTPYLSDSVTGRPLWRVTIDGWSVTLEDGPSKLDKFARTLDVYLDPLDGGVLKLETRWPNGVPVAPIRPDAVSAARQMAQFGAEAYHGFPDAEPAITLQGALDVIVREGGADPCSARQIIAEYVTWSVENQEPRAVWAITLWGVPPDVPQRYGTRRPIFHYRYIVDANSGEYLRRANTPASDDRASYEN